MERTYSLEWMDSLISVTLNPAKPYRQKISDTDLAAFFDKVPMESLQIQVELTTKIFSLNKENQARHIINKYYQALLSLRETLAVYQNISEFQPEIILRLELQLHNCLTELISFIETRFKAYLHSHQEIPEDKQKQNGKQAEMKIESAQRILCTLSADQIALILRGADESQVLKARSMTAVFKFIIPFLSTPHKQQLSAAAVRSKAYNPEDADRSAAIEALQKIIKKIESY